MSDSLRPLGPQHARPPCLSPTPGLYSSSFSLSQWCHPTISSSVIPFSHLQSFPASESLQKSQFFPSGGRSIGFSASASVLPMNIQDWFTLIDFNLISFNSFNWFPSIDWLDLLAVQGTLKSLLQHYSSKASVLWCSALFMVQLSHPYMTAGKTIALTRRTVVDKVCLCFLICCLGWS